MKKISILILLAMSTMLAVAQNGRIDLRHETKAEITNSEFASLRAVFSYGSIESIEVPTERGTFSEIAIEGTYASGEIGTPELPASHQLLAVPFGATPQVSVINFTSTDYRLSDYGISTLIPHQPSVRKDQNLDEVEFVYNAAAYQTRSLASMPEATIEVQGTMRGIRIGSLVINPVSYNPASNTLRVFNDIEVEINFVGADRAETERMLVNTYSPYFDIVYKQMFNYRQIMDVYDDHPDLMAYPVHMIVITPDNYISALQPWINWKIQKGFDVNVVTTAQAGGNYNAIQSYVQNLYNTGVSQGATPTFVILVGDTGQIPGKTSGNATQKVTDLYYGSIDGDYFPDMFYSRMSAENTNQVTAIVNKILQYEQYTMPDPSYLSNVTLIAGWDSYWNARIGRPTINYATTYYYNTAHGFNQVNAYLQQGQYTGCYNTLNTGVGFVNYTAHGEETSWSDPYFSVSNVNVLTNTNKYFLAMGNCCLTGNFGHSQPCFGEAMLRGENKAAYSYIGSCPVTYWYEDYYFGVGATTVMNQTPTFENTATGVYDGIWMDETYNTVSSITFLGNIAVCYAHAGNYQTSTTPLYYWQAYHVLGDGSIMPYRVNPTPNTVNHASSIPAGASSFTVNAEAGSYVGISQNNVLKGAALVPASGSVNVPVNGITSGQPVKIVVTKPQRQPYMQDITVGGGGGTTYNITVSANPTNGGTVTGGGTYNQGASCTVSATANNGYTFTNWTENGNVVSTNRNYTFTVNSNRTLVANFTAQPQQYTISVSANPSNGGTVTGGGTYNQGASCTVSATANNGYTFTNWTENGSVVSTQANYTFTVNANRTLVANFTQQTYTINISANPSNGGTVTGGGAYHYGDNCTVTATPANGYTFTNWKEGNNVVSTNASYSFTVTGNRTLVAYFTAQTYTITASANPTNGGTVTGGGTYNYGQSCTLTATPANGYDFIKWTKNGQQVSTNASYTFTVTESAAYVAHFQMQSYTVTLTANPTEGGELTGEGTFNFGQTDYIYAAPNPGYNFVNWTENGEVFTTDPGFYVIIESDRNFVANFEVATVEITTTVEPVEGGTATGGGTYNYGDEVTITIEDNEDWAFQNWTEDGEVVSEEKTFTFIATANRNFVAHLVYTEGIGEQDGSKTLIYPNPANDKLTIEAREAISKVEIYSMMGTLVFSQSDCTEKVEINTTDLPAGIYFVNVIGGKTTITKKVVIQ